MKALKANKFVIALFVLVIVSLFIYLGLHQYLDMHFFQSKLSEYSAQIEQNPIQSGLLFFLVYVVATALSLPGAAVLTLAAGALFGFVWGAIMVSFASTIGATLAFLISRYILRDLVESRFKQVMKSVNEGLAKEGALYLFSIRLIPLFPFVAVNLVLGLTRMKTWTYMWVSQIGMAPATLVYVNAGTQIAEKGFKSPDVFWAFVLLGLFPLIAKRLLTLYKQRQTLAQFNKPKKFDANLIVIGAGAAGLVASYIAAAVKAKVYLIEKNKMGGDCLNTGCVPSKALIRAAKLAHEISQAEIFGFRRTEPDVDFAQVMERIQRVITQVEPHDSVERYTQLGVECISGEAQIISPYSVKVNGRLLTAPKLVIATGARPYVPVFDGLDGVPYFTSDTIWELREKPNKLLIIGGGPIGCELAQAFVRLGVDVTLVDRGARILAKEDSDVSAFCQARLQDEGVKILLSHIPNSFSSENEKYVLHCDCENNEVQIEFSHVLLALGRKANTDGLGLNELGVQILDDGRIQTDDYLRTNIPTIFASGDVTSRQQFTHLSAHQSWYASVNALFGVFKKWRADYSVVPRTTFLDPEVATVGLNELEAKQKEIAYEKTQYDVSDLDRAIVDGQNYGFVKVLTVPGKDKILGVTIIASNAGELIAEYVLAMKKGIGLNTVLGTIHAYPTMVEANKYAAGEWKRKNAPEKALKWVKRFHEWQRG